MGKALVGAARFELATYWSQTSRATKLRYTPIVLLIYGIFKKKQSEDGELFGKKRGSKGVSAIDRARRLCYPKI